MEYFRASRPLRYAKFSPDSGTISMNEKCVVFAGAVAAGLVVGEVTEFEGQPANTVIIAAVPMIDRHRPETLNSFCGFIVGIRSRRVARGPAMLFGQRTVIRIAL